MKVTRLLVLLFSVLTLVTPTGYGQGLTGEGIATQDFIRVWTGRVDLCDDQICGEHNWVHGNLFTFTHPGTPNNARMTEWNAVAMNRNFAKGSFTLAKNCPGPGEGCLATGDPIVGEIFVEFNAQVEFVTPIQAGEPQHYNFHGPAMIVGGTGFYEGIKGQGEINGTYHAHSSSGGDAWLDFVLLGRAGF